jgi:hypothetical protein
MLNTLMAGLLFTGHWVGIGHLAGVGLSMDCTKVEMTVQQTADQFVIQNYAASCGIANMNWGPNTMQVQGSKVLDQGDEIGTLTDTELKTSEVESGVNYIFNLKLIPATSPTGQTILQSTYAVENDTGTITVESHLVLQP